MRYFAYCTLLDRAEMRKFCPGVGPGMIGSIIGWRVGFGSYGEAGPGGGCQLFAAPGHTVHGLVYDLDDEEMSALDQISGVDKGYYRRIDLLVETGSGEPISAITYMIPDSGGPFHPTASYTEPILRGARDLGLPDEYIRELEATIEAASGDTT